MNIRDVVIELQRWLDGQIRYREDRSSEKGYVDGMRVLRQKCADALKETEMEQDETKQGSEVVQDALRGADEERPVVPLVAPPSVPEIVRNDWPPTDAPILGDRVYVYLQLSGTPGERELVAMIAKVILVRPEHPMMPGLGIDTPNQTVSGLPAVLQMFAYGQSSTPKLGFWSWPPRPLR